MHLFTQTRMDVLEYHPNQLQDFESELLAGWLKKQPRDYANLLDGLEASASNAEAAAILIYADHMRRSAEVMA